MIPMYVCCQTFCAFPRHRAAKNEWPGLSWIALPIWGTRRKQDQQGNVWVEIPGQNPDLGHIALASHMDELAMVITAVNADGTLQVRPSGGLHPWKIGECPVEIVSDGAETVAAHLCFGSTHTTDLSDPNTQFATGQSGITWPHCHLCSLV